MNNILIWKNKCWESRGSNLGDLCIIHATINCIRNHIPEANILLLSDNPEYTDNIYGIKSLRFSLFNIIKSVKKSDIIILGGGTVFTDVSSIFIIPINLLVPLLGVLFRKKIVAWGIGSGKKSVIGRLLVRMLLPYFRYISVRDFESKKDLVNIWNDASSKICVTEDMAFALDTTTNYEKENYIIIAPRRIFHYKNSFLPFYIRKKLNILPFGYYEKMDFLKSTLAQIADFFIDKYSFKVVLLPMYSAIGDSSGITNYFKKKFSSRDDQVCYDIMRKMNNHDKVKIFLSDQPRDVLDLIGKSRLLIGVPLHSLILAHVVGVPFVGLSYQEKVSRFMHRSQMDSYMISLENMDSNIDFDEFREKSEACLNESSTIVSMLYANNALIREIVESPVFEVKNLLHY
ncbi:MAG: hypothetical protein C4575_06480 [Desulforudis sp.]|jgi:polysaccharide pyruvyl transferase WcaK-like protein|nr:MAG: hypothetical protein C4575_06480 [Desulforudis sp.]